VINERNGKLFVFQNERVIPKNFMHKENAKKQSLFEEKDIVFDKKGEKIIYHGFKT
jgi:hypothetical protein